MPELSIEFWIGTGLALITFGIGLAVTLAMDAKTAGEFRVAVACFLLSAGVIIYGIGAWQMSTTWPARSRLIIAYLLFAFVPMLTVEAIRWAHGRHLRAALAGNNAPIPPPKPEPNPPAFSPAPAVPTQAPAPVKPASASPKAAEQPPTLEDLFKTDFPVIKIRDDNNYIKWPDGTTVYIKRQLYVDVLGKNQFVGFYVPSSTRTYDICMFLVDQVQQTIDDFHKKVGAHGGYGDQQTDIKNLTFSGRVFLYHEDFLSITQKAAIIGVYTAKHLDVQFMGPDYLGPAVIAWHHLHDSKER